MVNLDDVKFRIEMQRTISDLEELVEEAKWKMPGCREKGCLVCKKQNKMLKNANARIVWLKSLLGIFLCLIVIACGDKEVISDVMSEDAVVVDAIFSPARHSSGIAPTFSATSGDVGFTLITANTPALYTIVFKCQHGKFIISGTEERYKKWWELVSKGDKVIVHYQEVYKNIGDNKLQFVKYKFYGIGREPN